jgi:hypothetical protein
MIMFSQHPSFHESMHDSFEIISLDDKVSICHYKNGILVIQGDEKIISSQNNASGKQTNF